MRGFEKISFEQFKKDIKEDKNIYDNYNLPIRKTKGSAGYDFELIDDIILKPKEIKKIPTGIKSYMQEDEVLYLIIRSSLGFKNNIRLTNQVGVIDSDYYNNETNEGHIFVSLQNQSDKEICLKKGSCFIQGIFMKYLLSDDDNVDNVRISGIGSTNGGIK